MSNLDGWETTVRILGIAPLVAAWVLATAGAVRGGDRKPGRASGSARRHRAHTVYAVTALPYFTICGLLWRPLPWTPGTALRAVLLLTGAILGAAGAAFYLSGRLALGDMYNVSSSLGSELYEDHRLVTSGPYRWCRHPMYLGLALGAAGGLLVYRTWTLVFMAVTLAGAVVKALAEERLLASEFGSAWEDYADQVPAFIPRFRPATTKEVEHVGSRT